MYHDIHSSTTELELFKGRPGQYFNLNGRVVARKGNLYLVWIPGHTCYVGGVLNPRRYIPAEIAVVDLSVDSWQNKPCVILTGRITIKSLCSVQTDIDTIFGHGTTAAIDLKQTLVLAS